MIYSPKPEEKAGRFGMKEKRELFSIAAVDGRTLKHYNPAGAYSQMSQMARRGT